jgi:hypothetical protein
MDFSLNSIDTNVAAVLNVSYGVTTVTVKKINNQDAVKKLAVM